MSERGQVDRVLNDAELEVVTNLPGELDADGLLGLIGGTGDMRRQNDVVECEEGGVLQGFLMEYVQGGSSDMAALESIGERLFDDKLAAGAVDDAYTLLHDGKRGRIDQ